MNMNCLDNKKIPMFKRTIGIYIFLLYSAIICEYSIFPYWKGED